MERATAMAFRLRSSELDATASVAYVIEVLTLVLALPRLSLIPSTPFVSAVLGADASSDCTPDPVVHARDFHQHERRTLSAV